MSYIDVIKRYRRELFFGSILSFSTRFFELIMILMIIPVLKGGETFFIKLQKIGVNITVIKDDSYSISLFLLFGLFYAVFALILRMYHHRVFAKATRELRDDVIERLASFDKKNIRMLDQAGLAHAFSYDSEKIARSLSHLTKMPAHLLAITAVFAITFLYDNRVAVGVLLFLISVLAFNLLYEKKMRNQTKSLQCSARSVAKQALTFFSNLSFFCTNRFLNYMLGKIAKSVKDHEQHVKSVPVSRYMISFLYESLGIIGISLFFFYLNHNDMDLKVALVLLGLIFRLSPVMFGIQNLILTLRMGRESLSRFNLEVQSLRGLKSVDRSESNCCADIGIMISELVAKLGTSYCMDIPRILLKPGEKVFVHGSSGAGKSTLFGIINGTIPFESGKLNVCGKTVYLGANSPLVQGTIRENILMGRKGDQDRLDEICQVAGLDEVFELRGYSFDTEIKIEDPKLSQGELQRMNICRGLLDSPDIILLDEATSSINASAEREVLKRLLAICEKSIVLFISHNNRCQDLFQKRLDINDGKVGAVNSNAFKS